MMDTGHEILLACLVMVLLHNRWLHRQYVYWRDSALSYHNNLGEIARDMKAAREKRTEAA